MDAAQLDDTQRLRYSRHLLLDDWSEQAQSRLLAAHALVIGAGGLGAPALMYLAAAGVGRITVVDPDTVELSNLQRQVVHTTASLGQPKAVSAQGALQALNPGVQVQAVVQAADAAWLAQAVPQAQVVLDCTDQFDTRQLINQACWHAGVPLVSASALQWDGQISVFDPLDAASPCYACLFPPDEPPPATQCATMGVFAPLVAWVGVMQAGEAIKLLAGLGREEGHEPLAGRLCLLDGKSWQVTSLRAKRNPACVVCAAGHSPRI